MNIKIRGKGKNKLRLEFEDEGYSIVNLLRKNLWKNGDVDKASYKRDHAYLGNFEFIVETDEGDPVQVLIDAAKKIQDDSKELQDKFSKAL